MSLERNFEFEPVKTTAVRLLLDCKVQDHWNKPTKGCSSFISIPELGVYEKE